VSIIGLLIAVIVVAIVFVAGFTHPNQVNVLSEKLYQTLQMTSSYDITKQKGIAPLSLTRDIARETDIKSIQEALLQYKIEKGVYPASLSELVPIYIAVLRNDPLTNKPYSYEIINKGNSYSLCVLFEKSVDQKPQCFVPGGQ
jgi:hypothetical protein